MPRGVGGRLDIALGDDQGDIVVHAEGARVVYDDGPRGSRDRTPLQRDVGAGGEERDVDALEDLGADGSDLELSIAEGHLAARAAL